MGRLKVELLGNLILLLFDDLAVELDQLTTGGADEMVVMLVIVMMLIATTPIAKPLLTRQTTLTQQLQCAIDRGEANRWILLSDQHVEVFSAKMTFRLEKDPKNHLTLRSLLQTRPSDVLKKYLFLLNKFGHDRATSPPADTTTIE
jgi:hypothetical protein